MSIPVKLSISMPDTTSYTTYMYIRRRVLCYLSHPLGVGLLPVMAYMGIKAQTTRDTFFRLQIHEMVWGFHYSKYMIMKGKKNRSFPFGKRPKRTNRRTLWLWKDVKISWFCVNSYFKDIVHLQQIIGIWKGYHFHGSKKKSCPVTRDK